MLRFEREAWGKGFQRVAGVDEAGRGTLAGPVVAAAVLIDPAFLEAEATGLLGELNDSKRLTAAARERCFALLCGAAPVALAVGAADADEIDRRNILNATMRAMARAVAGLPVAPDQVLVDGPHAPCLACACTPIVDGDALSLSVAAASIVAKVMRDRMMRAWDGRFPGYGLAAHKGYGTAFHTQALLDRGPSPLHRRSFRPVQDAIRIQAWMARQARVSGQGPTT